MEKHNKKPDLGDDLYAVLKKHEVPMVDANQIMHEIVKAVVKPIESLLKAELEAHLGYSKSQVRKNNKGNYRNGYSEKTITSDFGKKTIKIPRDRDGSFEPQIVPKYKKNINMVEEKVLSLYRFGMSERDISQTIEEIYGFELDQTTISRMTDSIMVDVEEFHSKPLDKMYTFVFIDGIRFKTRQDGYANEVSVYVVLGVNTDGLKEVIGYYINESENARYWLTVLNDLKERGCESMLLVVSDNLPGISKAIKSVYPQTRIQKCIVHQIRNSLKHVSSKHKKELCDDMKKIYRASSYDNAVKAFERFALKWDTIYGNVVKSWKRNLPELTTFFDFPQEIRRLIYTTNVIENLNRSIRKITKNKTSLPNKKSLDKLVYLAITNAQSKWSRSVSNWGIILNQLTIIFDLDIP